MKTSFHFFLIRNYRMLKIVLPDKNCLGPCFGIKRAFKKCLDIKDKKEFLIYGQLGHNRALCNYLKKAGFVTINTLKKAKNKKVIIRAHGINKKDLELLKTNKIQFIDLTCPFVKKFLNLSLKFEKKGYQIVIIGDKNHIEIKNVCSFLKKPIVVNNEVEAKTLFPFSKIAIFTQTTQIFEKINKILPILKQKYKDVVYIETRCPETKQRQNEVIKLASKVDLMLIIGDKISKNANNLMKICKEITKAKLIQGKADINRVSLNKLKRVGIIASASTPSFIVDEVIKCLKSKK